MDTPNDSATPADEAALEVAWLAIDNIEIGSADEEQQIKSAIRDCANVLNAVALTRVAELEKAQKERQVITEKLRESLSVMEQQRDEARAELARETKRAQEWKRAAIDNDKEMSEKLASMTVDRDYWKKLAAEYDQQVTLNRNNWMIDSEEKDRKISELKAQLHSATETPVDQAVALKIGQKFTEILGDELTYEQRSRLARLNRQEENPQICHSHDFTDANEVMGEAFLAIVGREMSLVCDEPTEEQLSADMALWSAAWDHAKTLMAEWEAA